MTDPVFYADRDELSAATAGEQFHLTGPEARHAVTVRRLRAGESLELVDGVGTRVACEFLRGEKDAMTVRVAAVAHEPAPATQFILVQALAKGDRDLQAAESATELGVDRVILWQADRSIVRLKAERAAKTLGKWQSTLTAAAKQSRRAHWPELGDHVNSTGLATLIQSTPETRWFVLHETAEVSWGALRTEELTAARSIGLIVGPEGGISDSECERFTEAGAHTLKLGREVVRASTAGPAALAALCAVTGRWS
ncbi:16S rRNA (uracil(1498)-N(3))-methyltransferase [Kocuria sp. cx-455]|uniref:16S rRNA (uracil(1498)-N(3))-methyltransferase n=1 Tax=Kocuria sp. cx-455 TaxID=2771377 RepID=UPI001688995F|nr:16S rRNA (uracil(1498)-N(3))-methyltransferase [Kocuria sp. cx-455]MBD2765414.1 16S rRNA (uracil(1498)-N(3))-methyltransferase [Kocuria sp. cx-455]